MAARAFIIAFLLLSVQGGAASKSPDELAQPHFEWDARRAVEAADRKELVRPAPPGFTPEPVARKLRLKLVARDARIRVGESFWYRLELQNVGRDPIRFRESDSFLKDGSRYAGSMDWDFFIESADGKRTQMVIGTVEPFFSHRPNPPIPVDGSEHMTDEQVADFMKRDSARREAERRLDLTLAPGETLFSRPWRWVGTDEYRERLARGEKELWPRPKGEFREFWTSYRFKKVGRYRIQAVLNDPPGPPPSEEYIRRMEARGYRRAEIIADERNEASRCFGRIESNFVTVEIGP